MPNTCSTAEDSFEIWLLWKHRAAWKKKPCQIQGTFPIAQTVFVQYVAVENASDWRILWQCTSQKQTNVERLQTRVGSITSNLLNYSYNWNYSFKFFNYIAITLCYKLQITIVFRIILKLVINYKSKLQMHFERICWMVPEVVPGQISH